MLHKNLHSELSQGISNWNLQEQARRYLIGQSGARWRGVGRPRVQSINAYFYINEGEVEYVAEKGVVQWCFLGFGSDISEKRAELISATTFCGAHFLREMNSVDFLIQT